MSGRSAPAAGGIEGAEALAARLDLLLADVEEAVRAYTGQPPEELSAPRDMRPYDSDIAPAGSGAAGLDTSAPGGNAVIATLNLAQADQIGQAILDALAVDIQAAARR